MISNDAILEIISKPCIQVSDNALRCDIQDWFQGQTSSQIYTFFVDLEKQQRGKLSFLAATVLDYESWRSIVANAFHSVVIEEEIDFHTQKSEEMVDKFRYETIEAETKAKMLIERSEDDQVTIRALQARVAELEAHLAEAAPKAVAHDKIKRSLKEFLSD